MRIFCGIAVAIVALIIPRITVAAVSFCPSASANFRAQVLAALSCVEKVPRLKPMVDDFRAEKNGGGFNMEVCNHESFYGMDTQIDEKAGDARVPAAFPESGSCQATPGDPACERMIAGSGDEGAYGNPVALLAHEMTHAYEGLTKRLEKKPAPCAEAGLNERSGVRAENAVRALNDPCNAPYRHDPDDPDIRERYDGDLCFCTDPVLDPWENCNAQNPCPGGGQCSADCRCPSSCDDSFHPDPAIPTCGNGQLDAHLDSASGAWVGEECDRSVYAGQDYETYWLSPDRDSEAWAAPGSRCTSEICQNNCTCKRIAGLPTCGNGILESGEVCDTVNLDICWGVDFLCNYPDGPCEAFVAKGTNPIGCPQAPPGPSNYSPLVLARHPWICMGCQQCLWGATQVYDRPYVRTYGSFVTSLCDVSLAPPGYQAPGALCH